MQGEKKLSREETLLFEAFALEMEHLSVGGHTGKTIATDLRVVVSRDQDTVEIEFIPLKTFLALKRSGLRL